MDRAHAVLSPSSAHRWLVCPASARLEETFEDVTSEAATEGTTAHAIAELYVRKMVQVHDVDLESAKELELYSPEMEVHGENYASFIHEEMMQYSSPGDVTVFVEQTVSFAEYVPEGFGSCDCLLMGDTTLKVIDYKYGRGVFVEAKDNPQLKLYALGAYIFLRDIYDIDTIEATVYQPRKGNIETWKTTAEELLQWAESIKPTAELAFKGTGKFVPDENACRFCKAKTECRARAEALIKVAGFMPEEPATLSKEELAELYLRADELKSWANEITDYVQSKALSGESYPGLKLVQGRSRRSYTSTQEVLSRLMEHGYDLKTVATPIPLSKLEKVLKTNFESITDGLIETAYNRPLLVRESDQRDEFIPAAEIFEEI